MRSLERAVTVDRSGMHLSSPTSLCARVQLSIFTLVCSTSLWSGLNPRWGTRLGGGLQEDWSHTMDERALTAWSPRSQRLEKPKERLRIMENAEEGWGETLNTDSQKRFLNMSSVVCQVWKHGRATCYLHVYHTRANKNTAISLPGILRAIKSTVIDIYTHRPRLFPTAFLITSPSLSFHIPQLPLAVVCCLATETINNVFLIRVTWQQTWDVLPVLDLGWSVMLGSPRRITWDLTDGAHGEQ